jgi:hypothetical protein
MLIRMTYFGTHIAAVFAAATLAAGAVLAADASTGHESAQPTALVIDASLASHGRRLVDPRLDDVDAPVRLPRDAGEARTNIRYFDALGYRVYVAGGDATKAARDSGAEATEVDGLDAALAAVR